MKRAVVMVLCLGICNAFGSSIDRSNARGEADGKSYSKSEVIALQRKAQRGDVGAMEKIENLYLGQQQGELPTLFRPGAKKPASKAEIKKIKLRAAQGDLTALDELGYIYLTEKRNLPAALQWYVKAANKGSEKALMTLVRIYKHKQNKAKEAEWLKKAANLGNAWALNQFFLNGLKKEGELPIIAVDQKPGVSQIKERIKFAKQGNVDAMVDLGYIYQHEKNNLPQAKGWYRKAAEKGNEVALLALLHILESSDDWNRQLQWLTKAARLGYSWAIIPLTVLCFNIGAGDFAIDWLKAAAKNGSPHASLLLKRMLQNKAHYVPLARAVDWYHMSGWRR